MLEADVFVQVQRRSMPEGYALSSGNLGQALPDQASDQVEIAIDKKQVRQLECVPLTASKFGLLRR